MVDSKENYKFELGVKRLNPSTPMSDQERISPYSIKQTIDENRKKYQLGINNRFNLTNLPK